MTEDPDFRDPNVRGEIYSPEAEDGRTDWPSLLGNLVLWALAIGLFFLVAQCVGARADELTGKDRGEWIKALRSIDKTNCCAEADGEDVYWEAARGAESGYRVFTRDGEWKSVPRDALITTPNRIGKALVWLNFTLTDGTTTPYARRTVPPSSRSRSAASCQARRTELARPGSAPRLRPGALFCVVLLAEALAAGAASRAK